MKKLIVLCFLGLFFLSLKQDKKKLATGKELFKKYSCSACHGEKGFGVGDLRKAYLKYSDEQIISYIKNPAAYNNLKMPRFETMIAADDYPALVAYVKHLGKSQDAAFKKQ